MAQVLPPQPTGNASASNWADWYEKLRRLLNGGLTFSSLDFTGSNITSIATRRHRDLQDLQGGTAGEYYHLTATELANLLRTPKQTVAFIEDTYHEEYFIAGVGGGGSGTGPAGPTGPAGAAGPAGPAVFLEADAADEMMPVFPGPRGADGAAGSPGAAGQPGPAIFLLGDQGDDGERGPPGERGATGNTGATGAAGPAVFLEADYPDEGIQIPGPPGPQGTAGNAGSAGAQGATGPAVFLEADYPDEGIQIPGPIGATGPTGPQGPPGSGGGGSLIVFMEGDPPEEPMVIPGPKGDTGATGGGGGGGLTYSLVTVDLGVARRTGTFDITGLSGLTTDKPVNIVQLSSPITSKGNARDEAEMDLITATGYVLSTTSIRAYWNCADGRSVAVGSYNFGYAVSA